MAKIGNITEAIFNGIEGSQILKDAYGRIQDVILPPHCEIISKTITDGVLRKIEFRNGDSHHLYES